MRKTIIYYLYQVHQLAISPDGSTGDPAKIPVLVLAAAHLKEGLLDVDIYNL
jgi:hypothetical protein